MDQMKKLLSYAALLPSGIPDPQAPAKLQRELEELRLALEANNLGDALTEAADVAYYAAKVMDWAARQVNLDVHGLLAVACAKYHLRAQPGNPKNHSLERAACLLEACRWWDDAQANR